MGFIKKWWRSYTWNLPYDKIGVGANRMLADGNPYRKVHEWENSKGLWGSAGTLVVGGEAGWAGWRWGPPLGPLISGPSYYYRDRLAPTNDDAADEQEVFRILHNAASNHPDADTQAEYRRIYKFLCESGKENKRKVKIVCDKRRVWDQNAGDLVDLTGAPAGQAHEPVIVDNRVVCPLYAGDATFLGNFKQGSITAGGATWDAVLKQFISQMRVAVEKQGKSGKGQWQAFEQHEINGPAQQAATRQGRRVQQQQQQQQQMGGAPSQQPSVSGRGGGVQWSIGEGAGALGGPIEGEMYFMPVESFNKGRAYMRTPTGFQVCGSAKEPVTLSNVPDGVLVQLNASMGADPPEPVRIYNNGLDASRMSDGKIARELRPGDAVEHVLDRDGDGGTRTGKRGKKRGPKQLSEGAKWKKEFLEHVGDLGAEEMYAVLMHYKNDEDMTDSILNHLEDNGKIGLLSDHIFQDLKEVDPTTGRDKLTDKVRDAIYGEFKENHKDIFELDDESLHGRLSDQNTLTYLNNTITVKVRDAFRNVVGGTALNTIDAHNAAAGSATGALVPITNVASQPANASELMQSYLRVLNHEINGLGLLANWNAGGVDDPEAIIDGYFRVQGGNAPGAAYSAAHGAAPLAPDAFDLALVRLARATNPHAPNVRRHAPGAGGIVIEPIQPLAVAGARNITQDKNELQQLMRDIETVKRGRPVAAGAGGLLAVVNTAGNQALQDDLTIAKSCMKVKKELPASPKVVPNFINGLNRQEAQYAFQSLGRANEGITSDHAHMIRSMRKKAIRDGMIDDVKNHAPAPPAAVFQGPPVNHLSDTAIVALRGPNETLESEYERQDKERIEEIRDRRGYGEQANVILDVARKQNLRSRTRYNDLSKPTKDLIRKQMDLHSRNVH